MFLRFLDDIALLCYPKVLSAKSGFPLISFSFLSGFASLSLCATPEGEFEVFSSHLFGVGHRGRHYGTLFDSCARPLWQISIVCPKFQVIQATFRIHGDVHQTRERRNCCGNSFRGWSRRNFSIDSPLFGFPSAVLALNVCAREFAFKYLSKKRPQLVAPGKDIPRKRNKFFVTI